MSRRLIPTERLTLLAQEALLLSQCLSSIHKALRTVVTDWPELDEASRLTLLENALATNAPPMLEALPETLAYLKVVGPKLRANRERVARHRGSTNISTFEPKINEAINPHTGQVEAPTEALDPNDLSAVEALIKGL